MLVPATRAVDVRSANPVAVRRRHAIGMRSRADNIEFELELIQAHMQYRGMYWECATGHEGAEEAGGGMPGLNSKPNSNSDKPRARGFSICPPYSVGKTDVS